MKPLLMKDTLAPAAGWIAVIRLALRWKKCSRHANSISTFNKKTTTTKTNGMCKNETGTGWGSEGVELPVGGTKRWAYDTRWEEHNHVFQDLTCWYSCGLGAEFSIIV